MSSEVTLTIPSGREFRGVAHFVLSGAASPLRLTVEHLDDLQIALGEVLARPRPEATVTIRLVVGDGRLDVLVGPIEEDGRLLEELEPGDSLGLGRVLETLADEVELATRDGQGWIRFAKVVAARALS